MTVKTPLSSYQRKLFFFLSVASFFEGYDFIAITQVLTNIRAEMHLDKAQAGLLIAFINAGTVVAYLLVRQADRWGRKGVMTITIAGYTLATLATAASPNVWMFAGAQFLARVFLTGEWAIATVYAAEEFPADRRGTVIGIIQGFSSLGAVLCAGLVPVLVQLPLGWRSVYCVGAIPLVLIAIARRSLRETERFSAVVPAGRVSFVDILRGPYRRRVFELALIWGLTYICTQNAVTFWKEFATGERGLTDGQVGLALSVAAVGSMPFVFLAGKLIDVAGRRIGALVIYGAATLGVFGSYTVHGLVPLGACVALAIFGTSAVLPVMNAYTTELFPTAMRGDAFAWTNNLLGRIGYVLSPLVVGALAEHWGLWGPAVQMTTVFPIVAVALIWMLLPETSGKELEETVTLRA